ncbi:hypothetical protein PHYPSEUDO_011484 [Phytophthora pseudosyringae]|uniref:Crinkler (CRN) family protein n=1 Tax=Phytophthora pseudosyringae TaxID=221518 RepID=A0A8T1VDH1_9STRA|nr:hypothetical protein PHYPSEUDO_011484 [Phytophthora pseudosyringae]
MGPVHVLVVVPKHAGDEKKTALIWRSKLFVPRTYHSSLSYFMLEQTDMDGLGLTQDQLMLTCRPAFHSQFDFLTKQVLDEGHVGYILGPPGTGKSTTAAAFALTVDIKMWIVTWIHVTVHQGWWCVRLVGDERQCVSITVADLDEVLQLKEDRHNHLVFVDGWTLDDSYTQLTTKCMLWFLYEDATMKRRLSFICSVASRSKIHEEEDIRSRASEFTVQSWTLEEYLDATEDDAFFNYVSPYLDVEQTSPVDRAAVVTSKYYYAGGSCRYMFCFSTADVKKKLLAAVSALSDIGATATVG